MPTIITRGLGYDEPTVVKRDVATGITATVVMEDVISGYVEPDDSPYGDVEFETSLVSAYVESKTEILGSVVSVQEIIGFIVEEGRCMSVESNRVEMFKGDNRKLKVTAIRKDTNEPQDLTDTKIRFSVKARLADETAAIFKHNSVDGGGDTEVKVLDATGGLFEIYLVPSDTQDMNPASYMYDIEIVTPLDEVYTLTRDRLILKDDVTRV